MSDGYDYFGLEDARLDTTDGKTLKKLLKEDDYKLRYKPIQYIPRDRLLKRQSYLETQRVQGENRNIELTDGTHNRLIIGFQKDAF